MAWIESKLLSSVPGVAHGFSDRSTSGEVAAIEARFGFARGIARMRQVHGSDVIVVEKGASRAPELPEGDALITVTRGVGVAVSTADCVPVLIADSGGTVACAVHAGWRGTLSRIVEKALGVIEENYDLKPSEMNAVIGPSIRDCCYEVGEEVALMFRGGFDDADEYLTDKGASKYMLDLTLANVSALRRSGVPNIEVLDICTKCREEFYSYRREGKGVGSQLSVVGLV